MTKAERTRRDGSNSLYGARVRVISKEGNEFNPATSVADPIEAAVMKENLGFHAQVVRDMAGRKATKGR